MNDLDRYYEILELEPGASTEQVKQAYRDLAKVWHPDRFSHDPRLQHKAQERLKQINDAYERLRSLRPDSSYPKSSQSTPKYQKAESEPESTSTRNHHAPPEPPQSESVPVNRTRDWRALIVLAVLGGGVLVMVLFRQFSHSDKTLIPTTENASSKTAPESALDDNHDPSTPGANAAEEIHSKFPAEQAIALEEFLRRHEKLKFVSEKTLDQEYLKWMREYFGPRFTPFYHKADFNHDGIQDFASILVSNEPPEEMPANWADTHRLQYKVTIVIFDGKGNASYQPVFVKSTSAPLVCFINLTREEKPRLYFGIFETSLGFIMSPSRKGYVVEELPD